MEPCNPPLHPPLWGVHQGNNLIEETSISLRKLDLIPHFRSMQEAVLSIPNSVVLKYELVGELTETKNELDWFVEIGLPVHLI